MARYALYNVHSGYIFNIIQLAEPQSFVFPNTDFAIVSATSTVAQFGGFWDGEQFLPPIPNPTPNDPAHDTAALFSINDSNVPCVTAPPVASSVTPAAVAAAGAVGVAATFARGDHVHAVPDIAPNSAPGRSLNTTFQPSATKQVLCLYSVQITCTANIAGGQNGRVDLLSDAASPPTTVRGTVQNRNSVSLAIALTAVNEQTGLLAYLCPAGHSVRIQTTAPLGAPAFSLISQCEIPIG